MVSYTTDGEGEQTSQNLIGLEGNIIGTQRYDGEKTSYYLYNKDIQGSTTSLIKEDGTADAVYRYTDFGETTIEGDNKARNEVCYTGGIYDSTTGLYYLNARYYNPEDGRFLTEDTYRGETKEPDTWHLYAYCKNNPVNYTDPSGHVAVKVVNGIVGAILGVGVDSALKCFLHYVAKKGSLRGFKISVNEFVSSAFSGLMDGILMSSKLKRNAQVVAGAVKGALASYIKNRKRNLKTIMKNMFIDAAVGGVCGLLGGNGIARKYWNRGLFRKGSYTYKKVTIKYGTKIKITSRNFKMTKTVAKESAKAFAKGTGLNVLATGTISLIKKCKKWMR